MRGEGGRGQRILELYGNDSMKPIYQDGISNETLKITAEIYSRIVFNQVLESVSGNVRFYHNMFETFPLEGVLKTVARILLETKSREDKNVEYKTAKAVFIKMTKMLNLTNKAVVLSTTTAQELSLYLDDGLENDQVNQDIVQSKNEEFNANRHIRILYSN